MKKIFLIDSENVGKSFLNGIDSLSSKDKIIYFHYEKCGTIDFEILSSFSKSQAQIEIIRHKSHGKNAMDFQICTYLGYLIAQYSSDMKYYIVSNDKGYESAIEFIMRNLNSTTSIRLVSNFSGEMRISAEEECILAYLQSYPKAVQKKTLRLWIDAKGDRQQFYAALQKELKSDGQQIYRILRKNKVA